MGTTFIIRKNGLFTYAQNFENLIWEKNIREPETNGILNFFSFVHSFSRKIASEPFLKTTSIKILPTHSVLNKARKILGISISDLADIVGVTRPTIYSFLEGNEPIENVDKIKIRLSILEYLTENIIDSKLPLPCSSILRRRNIEGHSLKELIVADAITFEEIYLFITNEIVQHQKNRESYSQLSNKPKEKIEIEAISVPISSS